MGEVIIKILGWISIPVIFVFCINACTETEWYKEEKRQDAIVLKAKQTPHVIRESADGCKVYEFQTDKLHYFTRCATETMTLRNYSESCGKNCTKAKTEEITTVNLEPK